MPEVQDIFTAYGDEYCNRHKLSIVQHKAMNAILNCRTERLGGHLDVCPECGYARPSYNSCRNRYCPKCQTLAKEKWINSGINARYNKLLLAVSLDGGDMLNFLHVSITDTSGPSLHKIKKEARADTRIYRTVRILFSEIMKTDARISSQVSTPDSIP